MHLEVYELQSPGSLRAWLHKALLSPFLTHSVWQVSEETLLSVLVGLPRGTFCSMVPEGVVDGRVPLPLASRDAGSLQ